MATGLQIIAFQTLHWIIFGKVKFVGVPKVEGIGVVIFIHNYVRNGN